MTHQLDDLYIIVSDDTGENFTPYIKIQGWFGKFHYEPLSDPQPSAYLAYRKIMSYDCDWDFENDGPLPD